jgi:hypothetical protein
MADAAGPLRAVRKTPEELGVRPCAPAPEGFDPIQASAGELRRYGYPARPDARLEPRRYQRWQKLVSRPISIIVPEFAVLPIPPVGPISPGPTPPIAPAPEGPINPGPSPHDDRYNSSNWGGVVAWSPNFDDPVTSVAGKWTVPHVIAPEPYDGGYICATWIGIDGMQPEITTLLQAGTTQAIVPADSSVDDLWGLPGLLLPWAFSDGFAYQSYAWWQWVPGCSVMITNLAVTPGDVMSCHIDTDSPTGATTATIQLINLTTGKMTPIPATAPPGTKVLGGMAEWIVEKPNETEYNGLPVKLPEYSSVYFDNCIASTRSGRGFGPNTSTELVTMTNDLQTPISTPNILTDDLIRVDWGPGIPGE